MKKLLVFVCVIFLIGVLAIPCYAETASPEDQTTAEASEEQPTEEITFLDRLNEFINEYIGEILSGTGILTTISLIFVVWRKIKPVLNIIVGAGKDSADTQDKQSRALNCIIDSVDALEVKLNQVEGFAKAVEAKELETAEHFKEVQKSLVEIAKLLDTVYSNSKALPQDVKNLVHHSYAECLRISDGELHGHINSETAVQAEENKDEQKH